MLVAVGRGRVCVLTRSGSVRDDIDMPSILLLGAPSRQKLKEHVLLHQSYDDVRDWPALTATSTASGRWRVLDSPSARAPVYRTTQSSVRVDATFALYELDGLDEVSASFALHAATGLQLYDDDATTDTSPGNIDQVQVCTPRNLTLLCDVPAHRRLNECVSIVAAVIDVAPLRSVTTKFGRSATLCVVKIGSSWPLTTLASDASTPIVRVQDRSTSLELTLWEDVAREYCDKLHRRDVILVSNAIVSRFKGKASLVSRSSVQSEARPARGTTVTVLVRADAVCTTGNDNLTGKVAASTGGSIAQHVDLASDYSRRWLLTADAVDPPSFASIQPSADATTWDRTTDTSASQL